MNKEALIRRFRRWYSWHVAESWTVSFNPQPLFGLAVNCNQYWLGIHIHTWGFRVMLVWWQVAVHWKELNPFRRARK